jgi:type I restriction enzyme M protein
MGITQTPFFAASWGDSGYYARLCFPMTVQTHQQLAAFIWSICNLLRGPYKRNEYRKVILPLTVLRRFDSILAPTKAKVLEKYEKVKEKPDKIVQSQLCSITGRDFYNISKLDFPRLLG